MNAATIVNSMGALIAPAPYTAYAVNFDSLTSLLTSSTLSSTDNGAVSLSFWFKLGSGVSGHSSDFLGFIPTNYSALGPTNIPGSTLLWQLRGTGGALFFCTSKPISTTGWHHILGSAKTNLPAHTLYWNYIAISDDGTKAVSAVWNNHIYISTDGGITWSTTGSESANWLSVACSSNGQIIVAGNTNGHVQTSTNGGSSWTTHTGIGTSMGAAAVSSDGTRLFIMPGPGGSNNWPADYLYRSTDNGSTFSQVTSAGSKRWAWMKFLSDNQTLIAGVYNDYLYQSTDGGDTWTALTVTGQRKWQKIAHSANGQKIVATFLGASSTGGFALSSDGGSTWAITTGYTDMSGVAMSGDGQTIIFGQWSDSYVLIGGYGQVWLSTDGGTTLTQTSLGPGAWNDLTCSSDATTMLALSNVIGLFRSTDKGTSWNETGVLNSNSKIIKLYVDDVDATDLVSDVQASFTVPQNGAGFLLCDNGAGTKFKGDIADYWYAPGVSLLNGRDIPVSTRREFISSSGKPVDPANFPAGGAVLLTGDSTSFGTNQLSGGTFTTTGTLTNAGSHP